MQSVLGNQSSSQEKIPLLDCRVRPARCARCLPGCQMSAHASMAAAWHPTLTKKQAAAIAYNKRQPHNF